MQCELFLRKKNNKDVREIFRKEEIREMCIIK